MAIWHFWKLPRIFLKMVGAASGRKLGWLMPFVAIGWLWAHGIVGSAGHAHGWGPRPGGATLQLAGLGNKEIFGVFQEVSMQQWARPNGPRANKMFAGP